MSSSQQQHNGMSVHFIDVLCQRLQLLLPNRTGHSIAEVELNPQFLATRRLLLYNSRRRSLDPHAGTNLFMLNLLTLFTAILELINSDKDGVRLNEKDPNSLTTTVILVKLLLDVVRYNWDCDDRLALAPVPEMEVGPDLSALSLTFDILPTRAHYYHYQPPNQLTNVRFHHLLDVLVHLLLPQVTRKVLALIRRNPFEKYAHSNLPPAQEVPAASFTSAGSFELLPAEIYTYVSEIDLHLKLVLRYISTANPSEYYAYLHSKIIQHAAKGEMIPLASLQKYLPLFKFIFYNQEVGEKMGSDVYQALPYIKSNSWKQAVLVFYVLSIKNQAFSRPEDYNAIVKPYSALEQICKNLFDYVATIFEDAPYLGCASMVQSWLSVLCVADFIQLEEKPNRLRTTFNKRLKFLLGILKDASQCANLDAFESLITLFQLSARFPPFMYEHPLYRFSLEHLDLTFDHLNRLVANFDLNDAGLTYDNLVVNFYIAAIMLKPEVYVDILVNKYHESKDNLKEVRILVKIIKGLSEIEKARDTFYQLMHRLSSSLKSMIYGALKILYQNESVCYHQRANSASSASSVSEKFSIDSDRGVHRAQSRKALEQEVNSLQNPMLKRPFTTQLEELLAKSVSKGSAHVSSSSSSTHSGHLISNTEEILAELFSVFIAAPELYFNDLDIMDAAKYAADPETISAKIYEFTTEVTIPLKFAFHLKLTNDSSELFESACALSMMLVAPESTIHKNGNAVSMYANVCTSNYIVAAICEACLLLSLTDAKFKSCFLFLNRFMRDRNAVTQKVAKSKIFHTSLSHRDCPDSSHAIEKNLLLSLCTHDIQFYNIAKITMGWHVQEVKYGHHLETCFVENLADTFDRVINDESVFTGFVSLHKRFRNILRDAKPTSALYEIWLIIYSRWLDMLSNKSTLSDDSLVFRHFTGFLVSTSGCFLQESFSRNNPEQKLKAKNYISEFFDRAIDLLTSNDLVIRVVVKDTLSNESHSAVYHLICTKLMKVAHEYAENKIVNEESILFIEQVTVVITAMISIKNDGSFVLVALLPGVCEFIIKFANMLQNPVDMLKLKLRFCKLGAAMEIDKFRVGLAGAFKLRNFYAKASAEWLEQAVFYDEVGSSMKPNSAIDQASLLSTNSGQSSQDSEIAYLNIDLATECSKCLALQLEDIILEIPEGTKDKDIRKYKDLAFSNYFSLFYKILQKYTSSSFNSSSVKSKYKIQQITDNVLKCISNILQFDTDIGMHFVLPLGYHENKKIRSIFLNVFANMLASRKNKKSEQEFDSETIDQISSLYDLYGATAEVASSAEHNLLASSLFGIFSYTRRLDKLFDVLLNDEISNVSRSTDIFRRNSTLTKLLSNFAKDYGLNYLSVTLKLFVDELISENVSFEVEKANIPEDTDNFIRLITKLVTAIVNSLDEVPPSFRYICSEIYACVKWKFEDAALVAVGSFIFLRFFCPAIISPETFFNTPSVNAKSKRSLMQLVKVIQNMANGSLALLKWPGLTEKADELNELNKKIFLFLKLVSSKSVDEYPFQAINVKPIAELRYLHKFLYTYFVYIKHQYILEDPLVNTGNLHERIERFRSLDKLLKGLGQPKALISLQLSSSFKNFDPSGNLSNSQYNEFMARMSAKNIEIPPDSPVIHNAIFGDGTPIVIINCGNVMAIQLDIELLIFKLFETSSQVWDNKFYMLFDFTGFAFTDEIGRQYISYLRLYAPSLFFKNCTRIYYFNIPRANYVGFLTVVRDIRLDGSPEGPADMFTYSQVDSPEIVNNLCLDEKTMSISRDAKVVFNNVDFYESATGKYMPVTLKIGRQWLQICFNDFVEFGGSPMVTDGFLPVEVHSLADISKCEVTKTTHRDDEFTIHFNDGAMQVTLKSEERREILRFLYFTTSRLPKLYVDNDTNGLEVESPMNWFGRLYNIVFQNLLEGDEEVRASAAMLFASLSTFYDIEFGISSNHARNVAFPTNTTDYIVSVSEYLSKQVPEMSYRFFKAFFLNYEKLPRQHMISAIMYISPWINNISDYIYFESDENGADRVADIVRQFCRLTALNKDQISCVNDYIWKKLFLESRLTSVLVDEIIVFAIDNRSKGPEWTFIISVIPPCVEVCGEVTSRLIACVGEDNKAISSIAAQSKLLEITVLVKICSSLFFNSYIFGQLYLADVFFLCTVFIDNTLLEFGADLQKLVINTIQSFIKMPGLTEKQHRTVESTIAYFSGQRARMLFGMTRDRPTTAEPGQYYNKAASFEVLCDYLNVFIEELGTANDRLRWRTGWSSYAINVAFNGTSPFQGRSVLIIGILSKYGINDSTASRILKLIGTQEVETLQFVINASVSCARIFEGLPLHSCLPAISIWSHFYFCLLNLPTIYQPGIQVLAASFAKLIEVGPDYTERCFAERALLEPVVKNFEDRHNVHVTKTNFNFYIFFVLSQGLKLSHIKHTSLSCLQKVFKTMYKLRSEDEKEELLPTSLSMPYLVFIYLNTSDGTFDLFLEEMDYKPKEIITISGRKVPKIIVDFCLLRSTSSKLTLANAANCYNVDAIDSTIRSKFLELYVYLFYADRRIGYAIYHQIKPALENTLIYSTSLDDVNSISELLLNVINDPYYSEEENVAVVEGLLQEHDYNIFKDFLLFKPDNLPTEDLIQFQEEMGIDIKLVQEMIYRGACSYVGGQTLED